MKARTLKELVGWYASWRKGPRARSMTYDTHVDCSPNSSEDRWIEIGRVITSSAGGRVRFERWLEASVKSDVAGWTTLLEHDKNLRACESACVEAGLIEPEITRENLPKVEQVNWETRPEGLRQRTMRLVEDIRTRIMSARNAG